MIFNTRLFTKYKNDDLKLILKNSNRYSLFFSNDIKH